MANTDVLFRPFTLKTLELKPYCDGADDPQLRT